MALVGLAHILYSRSHEKAEGDSSVTLGQAAQTIRMLHKADRANFFHANHLSIELFLQDPNAAIAKIDAGREERRGKA